MIGSLNLLHTFFRSRRLSAILRLEIVTKDIKNVPLLDTDSTCRLLPHLQGQLTDGTVFDSSFERGEPIEFQLGSGQVIKGTLKLVVLMSSFEWICTVLLLTVFYNKTDRSSKNMMINRDTNFVLLHCSILLDYWMQIDFSAEEDFFLPTPPPSGLRSLFLLAKLWQIHYVTWHA